MHPDNTKTRPGPGGDNNGLVIPGNHQQKIVVRCIGCLDQPNLLLVEKTRKYEIYRVFCEICDLDIVIRINKKRCDEEND